MVQNNAHNDFRVIAEKTVDGLMMAGQLAQHVDRILDAGLYNPMADGQKILKESVTELERMTDEIKGIIKDIKASPAYKSNEELEEVDIKKSPAQEPVKQVEQENLAGVKVMRPFSDEDGKVHLEELEVRDNMKLVTSVQKLMKQPNKAAKIQVLDAGHAVMIPIDNDDGRATLVMLPKATKSPA